MILRKQYYVQVIDDVSVLDPGEKLALFVHTGEEYLGQRPVPDLRAALAGADAATVQKARTNAAGDFLFDVTDTGFEGTFRLAIASEAQG